MRALTRNMVPVFIGLIVDFIAANTQIKVESFR